MNRTLENIAGEAVFVLPTTDQQQRMLQMF